MITRSAVRQPVDHTQTYEPRPQQTTVDWAALGQLAIKRFPKVHAILAK
ncbi:hypothetical protein [Agrobacterium pusense]